MNETTELEFAHWAEAFANAPSARPERPSERASKRAILRRHLVPLFGHLRLDAVASEVERYKRAKLAAGLSKKTINNHLSVLRRVLAWARAAGAPVARARIAGFELAPREPAALTAEQASRLLAAVDEEFRAMVVAALRAGLRLGELLALSWSDVDLEQRMLSVERAVVRGIVLDLRAGRRRVLPLAPSVADALRALPRSGPWVFTRSGERLSAGACKWPLYRAARRAGLPRVGWRTLSTTFARELARRGAPEPAVHALLGTRAHAATHPEGSPTFAALDRVVLLLELSDRRSTVTWRASRSGRVGLGVRGAARAARLAPFAALSGAARDAATRGAFVRAVVDAAVVLGAIDGARRPRAHGPYGQRELDSACLVSHTRPVAQKRAPSSARKAFGSSSARP